MKHSICLIVLCCFLARSVNSQPTSDEFATNNGEVELILQEIKYKLDSMTFVKKRCPIGFNYTVDELPKCYAVVNNAFSWDEAQAKCRQLHGNAHLAVIGNAVEDQFVLEILQYHDCRQTFEFPNGAKASENHFWIGASRKNATDCKSEFVWKLPTGGHMKVLYDNLLNGGPDCYRGAESCMGIIKIGAHKWQWNDVPCYAKFCPICEVMKST